MNLHEFIAQSLQEDIGSGDHSTLSSIDANAQGTAILKIKENGILAGVEIAIQIFKQVQPDAIVNVFIKDGTAVTFGQVAFVVHAKVHTILTCERLALNIMQRMSGIATLTNAYVQKVKQYGTKVLDTRKTTPLFRWFEKEAVKIGGGTNHRFGLYDMIMLKDNHIDYCGGIVKAVDKANSYLKEKNISIPIEVETRNLEDVKTVIAHGGVQRIMLDNFSPALLQEAMLLLNGTTFETEASGGITLETIESYAATGVQFISVGAMIHHAVSMDLSLKAVKN